MATAIDKIRDEALEEAAQVVERFNTCPVVIPPNGSLAIQIATAIRGLKKTQQ
jgi:hypothetical protein